MITFLRRAIVFALLSASASHAQPVRMLRGRLVADDSGDPIRNARVALTDDAAGKPVMTDSDGRFAFPDVPTAPRSLMAAKAGYVTLTAPASADVELRMVRSGAISGRVLDDLGEPLPYAVVVAQRLIRADGRITFEDAATGDSDDRGDYRVFGLPPGEFVLGIGGGTTFSPEGAAIRVGGRVPPRNYYLNASKPEEARPIAVGVGAEVTGIDLSVPLPPNFMRGRNVAPPVRSGEAGTIQGRISRPDGLPVRGAHVMLSLPSYASMPYGATSDDEGRYELTMLRPGTYRVAATSLANQTERFRSSAGPPDTVTVAAGETVAHIDITMPRLNAISGRVTDEFGDALANVNLRVLQIRWTAGRRRLAVVPDSVVRATDDRGRYRLFGLRPGRYLVTAVGGREPAGWSEPADLPGYARTFFPSAVTPGDAQEVEVAAGQDGLNVDVMLARGRSARISGRAFMASGQPLDGFVWLSVSARSGVAALPPMRMRTTPDGVFEFIDLAPGEYTLQAATSRTGLATEGEFAAQFVALDQRDVTDVALRMTAGSTVSGHITFDGGDPPTFGDLIVSAIAVDQDLTSFADNPVARAEIHDDWTFEMGGLNGPRLLLQGNRLEGWTLQKVLVGGIDRTDQPLLFGTQEESLADVEVVFTRRISRIVGTVTDGRGAPVPDHVVLVFPVDAERRRWWSRALGAGLTKPDGSFETHAMPPGAYYVAVTGTPEEASAEKRDSSEPAFMESLVATATRVTLTEGETRSVSLNASGR